MSPASIEWIGYFAALCTTGSFVPQAWMTLRRGDTRGISLAMYSAFAFGVCLWLVYGFAIDSMPMNVANIITLALTLSILRVKWRNRHRDRLPAGDDPAQR